MDELTLEPTRADFALGVSGDAAPLSVEDQARTDEVWATLKAKRRGHLYDGPLLLLDRYDDEGMTGLWSSYRRYAAAREDPQRINPVTPVGVSGVLVCGDAVVFAQRSSAVTSYPGFFELAPSGAVDRDFFDPATGRIDHVKQLLRELEGEVGLAPSSVAQTTTLGVVREHEDPCCDICVRIDLAIDRTALDTALSDAGRSEYEWLSSVPRANLPAFVCEHPGKILPTSVAILRYLNWT